MMWFSTINKEQKHYQKCRSYLLKNDGLLAEFLGNVGNLLYFGRNDKAQGRKLPHFSEKNHQTIGIMHF